MARSIHDKQKQRSHETEKQIQSVQAISRNKDRQAQDGKENRSSNKQSSVAERLNTKAKEHRKRERFLTTRMWISTLISLFFSDRGTIPDNIGNNILITNNLYVTKNHLTAVVLITELSEATPVAWTSDLVKYVKDQTQGVVLDITFKGQPYRPDLTPSAMNSKEKTWRDTLNNPYMPESYVRRAARCLYTLDVARSDNRMTRQRIYIKVRATDGLHLSKGLDAVALYLNSIGAQYKRLQSNIDEHIAYFTMMSDKRPKHLKDIPASIFSRQTLAESMPAIQGANDQKGEMLGFDNVSGFPYFVDFRATAAAKNIMIEALSGWGKSFLASYWMYPFYANGYNLAIMDIKGNEFDAITKALHGVKLSMRATSTTYINTFRWDPTEVFDNDTLTYSHERYRMSKERMLCICDLPDKLNSQAESLLEEFLNYVYKYVGATPDNVNTWSRTDQLNPYLIYDMFQRYLSHEIRLKYSEVCTKMLERLRIYMSRDGSKSHIYREAYSYKDVLDSKCLTFDFGVLESSTSNDPVLFHLKVMDMVTINDEYVSYKKKKGEWTVKWLEESQIVDDWLTKIYTREITLRRSQNQVTILLGNSVAALAANPLSAPIIENINIMALGSLNNSSRKFLIEEYGLNQKELEILEDIQTNPDMQRKFLLVNRMEKDATTAILEACVTDEVSQSKLFKIVDTVY